MVNDNRVMGPPTKDKPLAAASSRQPERIALRLPGRLERWNGQDVDALIALVVLGSLLPLLFAAASGSLLIPHNDDWGYRRIALELFRHGHLRLIGWNQMTLVGQILTVQPLLALSHGASWSFGVYGVLWGATALVATYCVARRFLPTGRAFIAAGALALAPGFLGTEPTFMTDVPSVASSMACLALGVAGLDRVGRSRYAYLAASLAFGLFGFSIREFGLAAPAAVLVAMFFSCERKIVLRFSVVFVALCAAVTWWSSTLPGPHEPLRPSINVRTVLAALNLGGDVGIAVVAAVVFSLFSLPYRSRTRCAVVLAFALGASIGAMILISRPFQGNLLTQVGMGGGSLMNGNRPKVFAGPLWQLLEFLGLAGEFSGFVLAVAWLTTRRRTATSSFRTWLGSGFAMLWMLIAFYSAGLILATGAGAFDRYVWPLAGPVAIVALTAGTRDLPGVVARWRTAIVGTIVLGLFVCAMGLALNSFAFDTARWHAGTELTKYVPASTVDAGYEWFGYHQSGPVHMGIRPGQPMFAWYEEIYDMPSICGLVLNSTFAYPHLEPAGITHYRLFEFFGPTESLYRYLYRTHHCLALAD